MTAPDPLDPAAVEAATRAYNDWASDTPVNHRDSVYVWMQKAITAYLDHSGLAEARASLERERKARHAVEKVNADEVLRKRTNLEARIEVAEMERDEAVARAEAAEREALEMRARYTGASAGQAVYRADLAVCREALAELAEAARLFSTQADYTVPENIEEEFITVLESAEALSRLDHSSEGER